MKVNRLYKKFFERNAQIDHTDLPDDMQVVYDQMQEQESDSAQIEILPDEYPGPEPKPILLLLLENISNASMSDYGDNEYILIFDDGGRIYGNNTDAGMIIHADGTKIDVYGHMENDPYDRVLLNFTPGQCPSRSMTYDEAMEYCDIMFPEEPYRTEFLNGTLLPAFGMDALPEPDYGEHDGAIKARLIKLHAQINHTDLPNDMQVVYDQMSEHGDVIIDDLSDRDELSPHPFRPRMVSIDPVNWLATPYSENDFSQIDHPSIIITPEGQDGVGYDPVTAQAWAVNLYDNYGYEDSDIYFYTCHTESGKQANPSDWPEFPHYDDEEDDHEAAVNVVDEPESLDNTHELGLQNTFPAGEGDSSQNTAPGFNKEPRRGQVDSNQKVEIDKLLETMPAYDPENDRMETVKVEELPDEPPSTYDVNPKIDHGEVVIRFYDPIGNDIYPCIDFEPISPADAAHMIYINGHDPRALVNGDIAFYISNHIENNDEDLPDVSLRFDAGIYVGLGLGPSHLSGGQWREYMPNTWAYSLVEDLEQYIDQTDVDWEKVFVDIVTKYNGASAPLNHIELEGRQAGGFGFNLHEITNPGLEQPFTDNPADSYSDENKSEDADMHLGEVEEPYSSGIGPQGVNFDNKIYKDLVTAQVNYTDLPNDMQVVYDQMQEQEPSSAKIEELDSRSATIDQIIVELKRGRPEQQLRADLLNMFESLDYGNDNMYALDIMAVAFGYKAPQTIVMIGYDYQTTGAVNADIGVYHNQMDPEEPIYRENIVQIGQDAWFTGASESIYRSIATILQIEFQSAGGYMKLEAQVNYTDLPNDMQVVYDQMSEHGPVDVSDIPVLNENTLDLSDHCNHCNVTMGQMNDENNEIIDFRVLRSGGCITNEVCCSSCAYSHGSDDWETIYPIDMSEYLNREAQANGIPPYSQMDDGGKQVFQDEFSLANGGQPVHEIPQRSNRFTLNSIISELQASIPEDYLYKLLSDGYSEIASGDHWSHEFTIDVFGSPTIGQTIELAGTFHNSKGQPEVLTLYHLQAEDGTVLRQRISHTSLKQFFNKAIPEIYASFAEVMLPYIDQYEDTQFIELEAQINHTDLPNNMQVVYDQMQENEPESAKIEEMPDKYVQNAEGLYEVSLYKSYAEGGWNFITNETEAASIIKQFGFSGEVEFNDNIQLMKVPLKYIRTQPRTKEWHLTVGKDTYHLIIDIGEVNIDDVQAEPDLEIEAVSLIDSPVDEDAYGAGSMREDQSIRR